MSPSPSLAGEADSRRGHAVLTAAEAWERYAAKQRPRRATNAAGATTWLNWTQYADHGPDESVLGELGGRQVLELGSGTGANLAHLASLGAHCVGVDVAPSRQRFAVRNWGHIPNIDFVTADVVEYLADNETRYDIVFSIFGAVSFCDPAMLLPLVHDRMVSSGVFAFSHLPSTPQAQNGPGSPVKKWDYSPDQWLYLLSAHGFEHGVAKIVAPPPGSTQATLLVRAFRPATCL